VSLESSNAFETRLEQANNRIRLEEPRDLRRLCSGIVDSGAGSKGQYFALLVFAHGELRNLAFHGLMNVLRLLDAESIDLEPLKVVITTLMRSRVGYLDFVGLHELASLWRDYLGVVQDTGDRDELRRATELMSEFGLRMHWWLEAMFPWDVGVSKLRVDRSAAEWLMKESSEQPWSEQVFRG
jgi:Cucumopine synthase C-terminal helical bundle domain